MSDQFLNDQRDQQIAAVPEDAAAAAIDSALKNVHTTLPGVIVSFDALRQTATVQPAIQRVFAGIGPTNLPLCVDCPVEFPSGGGFVLTFPVQPGDECVIAFSERCIDNWYVDGRFAPPADYRLHDLSDAIVRVGIRNQAKSIPGFRTDGAELRSLDGMTRVTVQLNTIEIVAPNGLFVNAETSLQGSLDVSGNVTVGNGASGVFTSLDGLTITVQDGIVTNIF